VNIPVVAPVARLKPGCTRVVSFHKNVPGVMRDINNILSRANVTAQALSTNAAIGYLVADVDSEIGAECKMELDALASTTRNYVLFQGAGYQGEQGL
jgi:D-3-phosphoglycerate dehydrogenase